MKTFIAALILSLIIPRLLTAEDAEVIVRRADDLMTSSKTYSESEMTVVRSGHARPTMLVKTYDMRKGDQSYSLLVYEGPAKMRGTAYLTIGNDLWVRFGSTGRIRKLSSSAKKTSAGGTDFSYSDMGESGQGVAAKYRAEMGNPNARFNGASCWEIHLFPLPNTEGIYEKLVAFVEKETHLYLRVDYFEAGAAIKSLLLEDYREIGQRFYPEKITMKSHVKPSQTEVITKIIEFESPEVQDRYFTTTYLGRIK
jgi:hypothetical protein